jgi:acetyltransferase-like isoleucine patch superfamily enzyme
VVIGQRTKIQSHAFVCELVTIGDDCFVSHGAMFVNDLFANGGPARGDRALWKSTKVGNHVSIGTNATILPVNICDHVVIGAGSVVTKDITESGIYAGNPARLLKKL